MEALSGQLSSLRWSGRLRPTSLPSPQMDSPALVWSPPTHRPPRLPQSRTALRLVSTLGTLYPASISSRGWCLWPCRSAKQGHVVCDTNVPGMARWQKTRALSLHLSLTSRRCFSSACGCSRMPQSLVEAYNASSLIWKIKTINTNVVFNVSW